MRKGCWISNWPLLGDSRDTGDLALQVALPFLHEHELPEAVRFEMQQAEEAEKASGALHEPLVPHLACKLQDCSGLQVLLVWQSPLPKKHLAAARRYMPGYSCCFMCPKLSHAMIVRQQMQS